MLQWLEKKERERCCLDVLDYSEILSVLLTLDVLFPTPDHADTTVKLVS